MGKPTIFRKDGFWYCCYGGKPCMDTAYLGWGETIQDAFRRFKETFHWADGCTFV